MRTNRHRPLITDHRHLLFRPSPFDVGCSMLDVRCFPPPLATRHLPLFLCLLLVTLGAGCRLVQTAVEVPGQAVRTVTTGKPNKKAVDPVEVQQQLMRFSDEFSTRLTLSIDQLRHGTNTLDPAEGLQWKIAISTETCSIASGPNAIANLLDMTVFVTMTRMALEENWMPKSFGESARPMLEGCRYAETDIWQLASTVLKSAQQAELRKAIEAWRRQNQMPESVLSVRAVGFASQVAQANQSDTAKPGSVFNLLDLDPLSGLDPATREIAQTRLFAERALYVTQKLPTLLRWQAELLSINAVDLPAVRQLVTNSTQIAASVDRFASVAGQLPGQVSAEREEILKALQAQETQLTPLVNEMRETLTAGTAMSTSLNTTLMTFTTLMQRFGVGETNNASPPKANAEPFRIQDYTQSAAQLEVTARQLTEMIRTLDQTLDSTNLAKLSAQLGPAVQQAQTGGKEIVDYAFWKGVFLVAVALVAALVYRFLVARLYPPDKSKINPP